MARKPQDQPEAGSTEQEQVETQSGEEYQTRGQVRVATKVGYRFRPSDKDLPEISPEGVNMTREQADTVIKESNRYDGHVYEVKEEA